MMSRRLASEALSAVVMAALLSAAPNAFGATVKVNDAAGGAGQTIDVSVTLQPETGESVAGTQNDFFFDTNVFTVAATGEGKPDCSVNPEINKRIDGSLTFGFGFLKKGSGESEGVACNATTETCNGVRAIVLSTDNVDPISLPLLYTCKVTIKPGTAVGEYPLANEKVILSDPAGQRLGSVVVQGGTVTVQGGGTTCACDCNGDGRVTGGEITRCVNILGRVAELSTCTAADSNKDGNVSGGDITRGVNALGAGTSCVKF